MLQFCFDLWLCCYQAQQSSNQTILRHSFQFPRHHSAIFFPGSGLSTPAPGFWACPPEFNTAHPFMLSWLTSTWSFSSSFLVFDLLSCFPHISQDVDYRYLIYSWRPPMYSSSSTLWLGRFFKLLIVCSKFCFPIPLVLVNISCPSTFLTDDLFAIAADFIRTDPSMSLLEGTFRDDWYMDLDVFRMFIQLFIHSKLIHRGNENYTVSPNHLSLSSSSVTQSIA